MSEGAVVNLLFFFLKLYFENHERWGHSFSTHFSPFSIPPRKRPLPIKLNIFLCKSIIFVKINRKGFGSACTHLHNGQHRSSREDRGRASQRDRWNCAVKSVRYLFLFMHLNACISTYIFEFFKFYVQRLQSGFAIPGEFVELVYWAPDWEIFPPTAVASVVLFDLCVFPLKCNQLNISSSLFCSLVF